MMACAGPDVGMQVCCAAEMACKEISPDSKCAICLDRFSNVSYTDRCFHRFCFRCILEWGKNKSECPLCKQPFSALYHSVHSEDDFKVYELRPTNNSSFGNVQGQRFRYRTTLTHQRRRELRTQKSSCHQEVMCFRHWLYRHGVRVRHVRDNGRYRDISAKFFRENPACLHRLVPWLKRELAVLYGRHDSVADVVLHMVLSLIKRHDMQDNAFMQTLRPFLSSRTEHFLHEFLSFARSPFNMDVYDQHAVYDCPAPSHLSAVSEDDADLGSAPSPWDDETPGPSYSSVTQSVILVTVSDSDVDSASEDGDIVDAHANISNAPIDEEDNGSNGDCIITGFIKPTTQRTPELIQLSSDSESSVQEEPEPSTSSQLDTRDPNHQHSQNTDVSSRSSKKHHSHRKRNKGKDYFSHRHMWRSCSYSYKDRRQSKAINHSSPSRTHSHTQHRHSKYNRDTHYSQDMEQSPCARSRSRARARSRSRARVRSRSRARARSRSRARARSRSRARARSRSRARARSRSRARERSRSRARARSRSRACACSRSCTYACFCRESSRSQTSLQNRKSSDHLSLSTPTSSHKESSDGKQKKRRRQSPSLETGTVRRKHHKKKKKHKRNRNRSKRQCSGARSATVIMIHTDAESAELPPLRDGAHTNTEAVNSSHRATETRSPCMNAMPLHSIDTHSASECETTRNSTPPA